MATKKEKPHADGKWTEAQFSTFIRNQLRRGWVKWPIKNALLKESRVERGQYECQCCGEIVPATMKVEGKTVAIKKVKGVNVDHILPATPLTGVYDWHIFVNRLYCERDNLWVICYHCHTFKTQKVERPLIKLLSGDLSDSSRYPVEVGCYEVESLAEAHTDPEKSIFLVKGENGEEKLSVIDILRSNGGLAGNKKGEQA